MKINPYAIPIAYWISALNPIVVPSFFGILEAQRTRNQRVCPYDSEASLRNK